MRAGKALIQTSNTHTCGHLLTLGTLLCYWPIVLSLLCLFMSRSTFLLYKVAAEGCEQIWRHRQLIVVGNQIHCRTANAVESACTASLGLATHLARRVVPFEEIGVNIRQ